VLSWSRSGQGPRPRPILRNLRESAVGAEGLALCRQGSNRVRPCFHVMDVRRREHRLQQEVLRWVGLAEIEIVAGGCLVGGDACERAML